MMMNLTGDRCQCPTCKEYFNSTLAFDKHRTGSHKNNTRRCMDIEEMEGLGMSKNKNGFWVTKKRPQTWR